MDASAREDMPWGTSFLDLESFADNHWSVKIGNYQISQIWQQKDEKFVVQNIAHWKYKSLDHAVKGLLKRMNS